MENWWARIDDDLEDNGHQDVRSITATAFGSNLSDAERVRELTELEGVGEPVASVILTVFDPDRFAVVDFRVLRALAAANHLLADPRQYQEFSEYVRWLLKYNQNPEVYERFMTEVRSISNSTSYSPREIDMALWVFDRDNS